MVEINKDYKFIGVDMAEGSDKTVIQVTDLVKTESSNVNEVAYCDNSNTAFVSFKNGSLYRYEGVSREDFETLRNAESVGKYLGAIFLKKGFEYQKLENAELLDISLGFKEETEEG